MEAPLGGAHKRGSVAVGGTVGHGFYQVRSFAQVKVLTGGLSCGPEVMVDVEEGLPMCLLKAKLEALTGTSSPRRMAGNGQWEVLPGWDDRLMGSDSTRSSQAIGCMHGGCMVQNSLGTRQSSSSA